MQQRTSEAVPELMTAAELSPQNASAQIERARALIANGNNAKAVPVLQRALTVDPSSPDAKYQLALAFQASGQEQQSIPFFRRLSLPIRVTRQHSPI
jgi:Tfp pilus assembly protein PilF